MVIETQQPGTTSKNASADKKQKKKSAKKKHKRISKHVLNAKKEKDNKGDQQAGDQPAKGKKKKTEAHIKDPSDVNEYLTNWKQSQTDEAASEWKFNKNTQSWLLRHMYEFDKVPKGTFTLLLDYLSGLKGEHTKNRVLLDARMRALRYKEYEKESEKNKDKNDADETTKRQQDDDDDEAPKAAGGESEAAKTQEETDQDEDTARWNALDDHDKRKEYKRARKVLEVFPK